MNLSTTFDLFRVVVWKTLCHNDQLAELDPSYDGCPSACTRPEADMKRSCPDCLVTSMYAEFVEEVKDELAGLAERKEKVKVGHGHDYRWRWSFEKMMTDINTVAAMDARVDHKGYQLDWTVTTRKLVSILREERANLSRAKDKEREANRNG